MFCAGAEICICHFCLLLLSLDSRYEERSKAQGPGGPMEKCDLPVHCEDTMWKTCAVQRLIYGLAAWGF